MNHLVETKDKEAMHSNIVDSADPLCQLSLMHIIFLTNDSKLINKFILTAKNLAQIQTPDFDNNTILHYLAHFKNETSMKAVFPH